MSDRPQARKASMTGSFGAGSVLHQAVMSESLQKSRRQLGDKGAARRPKWRMCFRLDKEALGRTISEVSWKHQRDFFITLVDPPVLVPGASSSLATAPPAPIFASELACQLANLLVSRSLLCQLPGSSFEKRSVAVVGRDGLAGGLVAAMLGARVAFLCNRQDKADFVRNVRLFQKDTLDYTKMKCSKVEVFSHTMAGLRSFNSQAICEALCVPPPLDFVVVSETALDELDSESAQVRTSRAQQQFTFGRPNNCKLSEFLSALVPAKAPTRVLLVCDGVSALPSPLDRSNDEVLEALTQAANEGMPPPGFELPNEWAGKCFSCLGQRYPVVWMERQDADHWRSTPCQMPPSFRRYLPPMGASSAFCGCGGHPQKVYFNHRVMNPAWHDNHSRLRDALLTHNQSQQCKTAEILEEARSFSKQARSAYSNSIPSTAPASTCHFDLFPGDPFPPAADDADDVDDAFMDFTGEYHDTSDMASSALTITGDGNSALMLNPVLQGSLEEDAEECNDFLFLGNADNDETQEDSSLLGVASPGISPRATTAPGRSPPRWESQPGEPFRSEASTPPAMASANVFPVPSDLTGPTLAPSRPLTQPLTRLPKRGRPQIRSRGQISRAAYSSRGGSTNSSTFYVPGIKGPTIAERHARPPYWYRCNRAYY